jgi:hypothetical protein
MKNQLKGIIEGLANISSNTNEFFLYIGAHGDKSCFHLYNPTGSGEVEYITYRELSEWLSGFLEKVNIVIFIDACRSGGAIPKLKELESGRTGLTIMTSTDDKTPAAGGEGLWWWPPTWLATTDSGTEDFMEGSNADLDKDRKKGDLGDLWKSMKSQGARYNPQKHSVGQASLLD